MFIVGIYFIFIIIFIVDVSLTFQEIWIAFTLLISGYVFLVMRRIVLWCTIGQSSVVTI